VAEENLVQNPEIVARIAQLLGMRQAHVTPALNEGMQAVLIVGDTRDLGPVLPRLNYTASHTFIFADQVPGVAASDSWVHFFNNPNVPSRPEAEVWRLKRLMIRTIDGSPILIRGGMLDVIPTGGAATIQAHSFNRIQYPTIVGTDTANGPMFCNYGAQATGNNIFTRSFQISLPQLSPLDFDERMNLTLPPGKGWGFQTIGAANPTLYFYSEWWRDFYV